jgi:hypothetical protein
MKILLEYCSQVADQEMAGNFAKEIILNAPRCMSQETLVMSLNLAFRALLESIIDKIDKYEFKCSCFY